MEYETEINEAIGNAVLGFNSRLAGRRVDDTFPTKYNLVVVQTRDGENQREVFIAGNLTGDEVTALGTRVKDAIQAGVDAHRAARRPSPTTNRANPEPRQAQVHHDEPELTPEEQGHAECVAWLTSQLGKHPGQVIADGNVDDVARIMTLTDTVPHGTDERGHGYWLAAQGWHIAALEHRLNHGTMN